MPRSKATVAEVAAEAGVSTATVSRVLTGSKAVSGPTAHRVQTAAAKLRYSGNAIAKALRQNLTGNIGMLVPSISNPFFTSLVEQVEHELAQVGLNLFLCDSQGSTSVEATRLKSLTQGSVDGILVSPVDEVASRVALTRAAEIVPVVQVDRRVPDVDTDWVGLDDAHAMTVIVDHLVQRGARRLTFVTSTQGSSSARERLESTRAAATRADLAMEVLDGDFTLEWGARAGEQLLTQGQPLPDGIICSDDLIAMGLLGYFSAHGVSVPGDVAVTGFDDIEYASLYAPSLTTLRQPLRQIASEAVRLLQENIRAEDRMHARLALRGELIIRQSSAAAGAC